MCEFISYLKYANMTSIWQTCDGTDIANTTMASTYWMPGCGGDWLSQCSATSLA